jgi:hypothetical protein
MISFASLEQQRQLLGQNQETLSTAIQEYLRSNLLEYELARAAAANPAAGELTLRRSQAEEMVDAVLALDKDPTRLEPDDLLDLNRMVSDSEEAFRQVAVPLLNPAHQPLDLAIVPKAFHRFFEWVRSPSFGEIHAIEQMTLSQIRLCEIQPFEQHSPVTISLFCLLFLLRGGYLMPLYRVQELADYHRALEQAFLLSTEDLVRFNTRACERAYRYALMNL